MPTTRLLFHTIALPCAVALVATASCGAPEDSADLTATTADLTASVCDVDAPTQRGFVTLDSAVEGQQGYDFSAQRLVQLQSGDFYLNGSGTSARFFANNTGQRGVVSVGNCASLGDVNIPSSGYTRQGVAARAGECYVALPHNAELGHIVFRVDSLSGSQARLFYTFVSLRAISLNSAVEGQQGYDFSAQRLVQLQSGDFYLNGSDAGARFFANNTGQRGVVSVGTCANPGSVTIPTSGFTRQGVTVRVGECYVALTHNLERDHILFRVTRLSGSVADLEYVLAKNIVKAISLNSAVEGQQGYDFSAQRLVQLQLGDFYLNGSDTGARFFANNNGQRGVVSVGNCADPTVITIPTSGFTRQGVAARAGECYVSLAHNNERGHILFRVTRLSGSVADLDYVFAIKSVATMNSAVEGQQGYDFSERRQVALQNGDFYLNGSGASARFFANNTGQRGVVSVGTCADPALITIPTTGFTRQGVTARAGECYVALSEQPECDHILFRVTSLSGSVATLEYIMASQR